MPACLVLCSYCLAPSQQYHRVAPKHATTRAGTCPSTAGNVSLSGYAASKTLPGTNTATHFFIPARHGPKRNDGTKPQWHSSSVQHAACYALQGMTRVSAWLWLCTWHASKREAATRECSTLCGPTAAKPTGPARACACPTVIRSPSTASGASWPSSAACTPLLAPLEAC